MDIVMVRCIDMAYSSTTWSKRDIADNFGIMDLDIVGWLVEDRKDCMIVAAEFQPDEDQFRHLQAIPKVCIKEVRKLRKR